MNSEKLPVRTVRKNPTKSDFALKSDQGLKTYLQSLTKGRDGINALNGLVREALDVPENKLSAYAARFFHAIVPRKLWGVMPAAMIKFVAEEYDVLEYIETLMRGNVDNVQEALRSLAYTAMEKREELNMLGEDLARAEAEEWDAETLQEYLAKRAGIAF